MDKKIYRSRKNKIIAGVCGGLGEYFKIDPVIIRILFITMTVFGGTGLLLYIISAFIIPKSPVVSNGESEPETKEKTSDKVKLFLGVGIILIGVFIILEKFNISFFPNYLFSFKHYFGMFFWPIILIITGSLLILSYKKNDNHNTTAGEDHEKSFTGGLYRSRTDKKWLGLCGGLAEYFKVDASIIRISVVIVTFYSGIFPGIIAYIVASLILPEKPIKTKSHTEEPIHSNDDTNETIIDADYEEELNKNHKSENENNATCSNL